MESSTTQEVAATHASGNVNILAPDVLMVILTWVTFFCLLAILQKFAWKPILTALKAREDDIRKSLEAADQAKAQLAQIEQSKASILNEARTQANLIVEQSRKTANELAGQIEHKAKKNAEDIVKSAHEEIAGERERVKNSLKKVSVETAVALAEKILKENMDTEKNKRLINDAMKEI